MTADALPRPLLILGEEFRLMDEALGTRMRAPPFATGAVFDIFDLVDKHLVLLNEHVAAFSVEIDEGLGQLTHGSDDYFHRAASRLNAELEVILDGYDEVRGLQPNHEDFEGWSLVVEIYEETLYQIQDWLAKVVQFVDDPEAGARKRGIPADGGGVVNLCLEMKPPRQLNRLTRWLERRGRDLTAARNDARAAHRTGMVTGTLLGLWMGKG